MYRNYLMQKVIDTQVDHTDIRTSENVNGMECFYYTPWYTTFSWECEHSWWMPKPSFNYCELRNTTMLEF
jgi:hypothetical protein